MGKRRGLSHTRAGVLYKELLSKPPDGVGGRQCLGLQWESVEGSDRACVTG